MTLKTIKELEVYETNCQQLKKLTEELQKVCPGEYTGFIFHQISKIN